MARRILERHRAGTRIIEFAKPEKATANCGTPRTKKGIFEIMGTGKDQPAPKA
jgi:hypothetical protein